MSNAASQTILQTAAGTLTSAPSRIFTCDEFTTAFAPTLGLPTISPTDLSVLLTHLSRDRAALTYAPASNTIKFPSPTDPGPVPITPEDVSIASLRALISSLNSQVALLTARISDFDASARDAVAHKRLATAKNSLRQKRQADATLSQRVATLAQLEAVYADIERAADQVEMVAVMREAGRTLKKLNVRTGGVEAVEEVVEGLREEMGTVEEIGAAMAAVGAAGVDEEEVEEELEMLERGAREEREKERVGKVEQGENARAEEEVEVTRRRLEELEGLGAPKGEVGVKSQVIREGES